MAYKFDMTDEEVANARKAGKLAKEHLKGAKLTEALTIGESLLVGRRAAMKAVGLDPASNRPPSGKAYAEAFRDWKEAFHFPRGKDEDAFYDDCIGCAAHRSVADGIMASLSIKDRANMGASGLAKRVRAKLREFEGGPAARRTPLRTSDRLGAIEGRFADMEERLSGRDPLLTWLDDPYATARNMVRRNRDAARRLMQALGEELTIVVDWEGEAGAEESEN
jgi:hypothetical protein